MSKLEQYERLPAVIRYACFNPLSANPTKWWNTLKQIVAVVNKLFECVWPFCVDGAEKTTQESVKSFLYLKFDTLLCLVYIRLKTFLLYARWREHNFLFYEQPGELLRVDLWAKYY